MPFEIKNGVLKKYTAEPGVTAVTIPDGVTEIGSGTFRECENLQKVTLPDGLKKIGSEAFRDCENLTEMVLPESVVSIGEAAFFGSWRITVIRLRPDDPAVRRFYDAETDEPEAELMEGLNMLRNRNYGADVLRYFKYPLLFLHWLHTRDEELTAYFRAHLDDVMQDSISFGDLCVIEAFAQEGGFFTSGNIDRYMEKACEEEQNEIFMILLNYKNAHFGFDESQKLKL